MYNLDSLNLDNNSRVREGGFVDGLGNSLTVQNCTWKPIGSPIDFENPKLNIKILITAENFETTRTLEFDVTGETSLNINSFPDFVNYCIGLILNEPEFENSEPV